MEYDPIKDKMGVVVRRKRWLRRLFYRLLDLVFLRAWYVHRAIDRVFRELEQKSTNRPVQVLDAGSGFGQYSYYIARRYPNARITAVDVKRDYVEDCRAFFKAEGLSSRVNCFAADLTTMGLPPFEQENFYDLILSVDVMEHIRDDRAVFRNFAYSLQDGGYVLINTPSDLGGSDVRLEGEPGFIGEHVRDGYNRLELELKLRESGLEPVRSEYGYGTYGSIAWRMLIKWPMQLLNKSRAAALLLPLYYLPVLPFGMLFNAVDFWQENKVGTGLTVVARKSSGWQLERPEMETLQELGA